MNRLVFINCPFSHDYLPLFRAMIFAIQRCGFSARCALEMEDASENRLEKICTIISECDLAVHDISFATLDPASGLARFNMPLELGLFIGAKRFGTPRHHRKRCIVFDSERHRYQKYISDISGQDIRSHSGDAGKLIEGLAAWLRDVQHDDRIPGGRRIAAEYSGFSGQLDAICAAARLHSEELTFRDLCRLTSRWIEANASR